MTREKRKKEKKGWWNIEREREGERGRERERAKERDGRKGQYEGDLEE